MSGATGIGGGSRPLESVQTIPAEAAPEAAAAPSAPPATPAPVAAAGPARPGSTGFAMAALFASPGMFKAMRLAKVAEDAKAATPEQAVELAKSIDVDKSLDDATRKEMMATLLRNVSGDGLQAVLDAAGMADLDFDPAPLLYGDPELQERVSELNPATQEWVVETLLDDENLSLEAQGDALAWILPRLEPGDKNALFDALENSGKIDTFMGAASTMESEDMLESVVSGLTPENVAAARDELESLRERIALMSPDDREKWKKEGLNDMWLLASGDDIKHFVANQDADFRDRYEKERERLKRS